MDYEFEIFEQKLFDEIDKILKENDSNNSYKSMNLNEGKIEDNLDDFLRNDLKFINAIFIIQNKKLENIITYFKEKIKNEVEKNNLENAKNLIEKQKNLNDLIEKNKKIQNEISNLISINNSFNKYKNQVSINVESISVKTRLTKGLKTPEKEYFKPILSSLVELGGSAAASTVLQKVYEKMKDKFTNYDMQSVPTHPKEKIWHNTARWARKSLVENDLLSKNSEYGIWEITEEGRRYLENLDDKN